MKNIYDINFKYRNGNTLEVVEDISTMQNWEYQNPEESIMSSFLDIVVEINNDGDLEISDNTPYDRWYDYLYPEQDIPEDGGEEESEDEPEEEPEEVTRGLSLDNDEEENEHEDFVINHYVVERAVIINGDEEPELAVWYEGLATTLDELRHDVIYPLNKDGFYHYQKLILPTKEHKSENPGDYIWYDKDDHLVHFGEEGQEVKTLTLKDNFTDIFDEVLKEGYLNCFVFSADTFSMYNLILCYVMKERERIQMYLKNSCNKCNTSASNLEMETDILLSAINVLDFLIEHEDYTEAQRVLNGLSTCGSLCKSYSNKLKGCNCGRA